MSSNWFFPRYILVLSQFPIHHEQLSEFVIPRWIQPGHFPIENDSEFPTNWKRDFPVNSRWIPMLLLHPKIPCWFPTDSSLIIHYSPWFPVFSSCEVFIASHWIPHCPSNFPFKFLTSSAWLSHQVLNSPTKFPWKIQKKMAPWSFRRFTALFRKNPSQNALFHPKMMISRDREKISTAVGPRWNEDSSIVKLLNGESTKRILGHSTMGYLPEIKLTCAKRREWGNDPLAN